MKTGRALHPLVEKVLLSGDEISIKVEEVGRYGTARSSFVQA